MSQLLDRRTRTELYRRQLESGFSRLRFSPAIEPDFIASHAQRRMNFTRIGLLLAASFYAAFLLLKLGVSSGAYLFATTLIRSFIILITLTTAWMVGRLPRHGLQVLMMANYLLFTTCLLAIEVLSLRYGETRHYEGMIFVIFHCALFSGMLFRHCLFTIVAMFSLYAVLGALFGLPMNELPYQTFFLLLGGIMACVSLYLAEYAERDSFLRRHLMAATANFDDLTGLSTRAAFDRYLKSHLRRMAADEPEPQALVLLDLDYFKQLNDSRGHDTGDKCLKLVADILRSGLPGDDRAIARWGGDELIAVVAAADGDALHQQLERIRLNVLALQMSNPGSPLNCLSVSIGVLHINPEQRLPENLLFRQVDAALYEAKKNGRNQLVTRKAHAVSEVIADPAPITESA